MMRLTASPQVAEVHDGMFCRCLFFGVVVVVVLLALACSVVYMPDDVPHGEVAECAMACFVCVCMYVRAAWVARWINDVPQEDDALETQVANDEKLITKTAKVALGMQICTNFV